jgi:hypothetical protein
MSIFTHPQVTHRVPRFQQITSFDPVHNLFHYTTTNPSIYMFGQPLPAFEPHPSRGHTVTVTRMAHAPSRPHPLTGAATRRRRADSATPAPASTASERPSAHGGSTTSSGPTAPPTSSTPRRVDQWHLLQGGLRLVLRGGRHRLPGALELLQW